jgi:hypothetical protein
MAKVQLRKRLKNPSRLSYQPERPAKHGFRL